MPRVEFCKPGYPWPIRELDLPCAREKLEARSITDDTKWIKQHTLKFNAARRIKKFAELVKKAENGDAPKKALERAQRQLADRIEKIRKNAEHWADVKTRVETESDLLESHQRFYDEHANPAGNEEIKTLLETFHRIKIQQALEPSERRAFAEKIREYERVSKTTLDALEEQLQKIKAAIHVIDPKGPSAAER